MQANGAIVGVWAHPDDETYLSAGIMADAVGRGSRVVVVMATRGEGGTADPETWPPDRLAPVRARELEAALGAVGVTDVRWLGYSDGGCAAIDDAEASGRIERILDEVAPATVLTFGPDGMTGHDDHVAVSRWTTGAFVRAGKPGARLLYATLTQAYLDQFAELVSDPAVFLGNQPPVTPDDDIALAFDAGNGYLEAKRAAILAHASQIEPFLDSFGIDLMLRSSQVEYFRDSGITPG